MNLFAEAEVYNACRLLFGSDLHLNRDFLRYLQPAGAKTAYRQRAKETHPDRFHGETPFIYRQKVKHFQDLNRAYELLVEFLDHRGSQVLPLRDMAPTGFQRPRPQPRPPYRPQHRPQPQPRPTRPAEATEPVHCTLPKRPLEFGLYLYYRGCIDFRQLIQALAWQRCQRPNLGDIAQRWGWLDARQVQSVLRYRSASGYYRRFGERAVELRLLNQRQLQTLLFYQCSIQRRIGEFFLEQGLLTAARLQQLLQEHEQHNRQFPTAYPRAF